MSGDKGGGIVIIRVYKLLSVVRLPKILSAETVSNCNFFTLENIYCQRKCNDSKPYNGYIASILREGR